MESYLTRSLLAALSTPAPPAATRPPPPPSTSLATAWETVPTWAIVLVLAALAASVAAALVYGTRRRRRRRTRRAGPPRLPIVLAHGLMGFDEIGVGPLRGHYFRGVPDRLGEIGCEVHRPAVARTGSVAQRAAELAAHVRAIASPRVSIIAHSMGGLDARYALSRLGLARKVAVLVTIGTPHRGTPIADLGTELVGEKLGLRRALDLLGMGLDAFYDITSVHMQTFNRETRDARGVVYASVVAAARDKLNVNPALLPTYLYLADRVGPNDGLVPASSQAWGEVLAEIEADHWAQIGWSRHFDARELYAGLARELRGRGF